MSIKVKITIVAELDSLEFDSSEAIIDEFSADCNYSFPSTSNVDVINTEFRDCELI